MKWGQLGFRARTIRDDNLQCYSPINFGVFQNIFGSFECFVAKHHRKLQKSGGIEFHFTPLLSERISLSKETVFEIPAI